MEMFIGVLGIVILGALVITQLMIIRTEQRIELRFTRLIEEERQKTIELKKELEK